MKKKLLLTLLALTGVTACAVGLAACGDKGGNGGGGNGGGGNGGGGQPPINKIDGTEGLSYSLSNDETYYICNGIGTATAQDIVIAYDYNNLPVAEIAEGAFEDCTSIRSVVIQGSVKTIGVSAFNNCENLIAVDIKDGVERIEDGAFILTGLTRLTIPDSVKFLGIGSFSIDSLTTVDLGHGVEIIDRSAFAGTAITEITIPASVYAINGEAFGQDCTHLTSITFEVTENWVASADDYTKKIEQGAEAIPSMDNPETVATYMTERRNNSRYQLYWWKNTELFPHIHDMSELVAEQDPTCTVPGFKKYQCDGCGETYTQTIPAKGHHMGEWELGESETCTEPGYNIRKCVDCQTVDTQTQTIPAKGHHMGEWEIAVDANCTEPGYKTRKCVDCQTPDTQTQPIQPNGHSFILYICEHCDAFDISRLQFTLINNNTEYSVKVKSTETSFKNSVPKLIIPEEYDGKPVTEIGSQGFQQFARLTEVVLPDTITKIDLAAFSSCTALETIELPESLTKIESNAFYNCRALTEIDIPDNVTFIGSEAFRYTNLLEVTVPEKVTSVGAYAFASGDVTTVYWNAVNCRETGWIRNSNRDGGIFNETEAYLHTVTKLYIGEDVEFFPYYVVYNNFQSTLSEVYFEGTLEQWCDIEFDDDPLTYVEHFYINNAILTGEITLPNTVTAVPNYTFKNSTVTSVTIPNSVTKIGYRIFDGCKTLQSLSIPFVGAAATGTTGEESIFGYYFSIDRYEDSYQASARIPDGGNTVIYNRYIPTTLTKVVVTGATIGAHAFAGVRLAEITLSTTITSIGDAAFANATILQITYEGTTAQWNNVSKGVDWDGGRNYTLVCKGDEQ